MSDICVVHLVRAQNGIAPFKTFLDSYQANPGGVTHDSLFIFKGFPPSDDLTSYKDLLTPYSYKIERIDDKGFDLNAYFLVAKNHNYKYFCFLNSFTTLLDKEWLIKLYNHIQLPGVGMVGATGSYESPYNDIIIQDSENPIPKNNLLGLVGRPIMRLVYKHYYDPFPNYHIRTNGFMIARDIMMTIKCGRLRTKLDAYRCENGKNSISKQIMRMNLNVFVIGKNGKAYDKTTWHISETFRQGNQSNLLIADNQTNAFISADPILKRTMMRNAWGGPR